MKNSLFPLTCRNWGEAKWFEGAVDCTMTLHFVEHCDSLWVLILRENCFNNNFNFIRKRTCMLHILFEVHQIHKKEVCPACILVSDCGELGKTVKTSPNFWIAYFHDIHWALPKTVWSLYWKTPTFLKWINSLLWKAYSFSFEMKSQIISQISIMLQMSILFVGRHDFHRRGHTFLSTQGWIKLYEGWN